MKISINPSDFWGISWEYHGKTYGKHRKNLWKISIFNGNIMGIIVMVIFSQWLIVVNRYFMIFS